LESSQPNGDLRLARAYQSLEGLSCGDAFGERFFLPDAVVRFLIPQRAVPAPPWFYTDDTMMALGLVATLEKYGTIEQEYLATRFAADYEPSRGYGEAMHTMLPKLRRKPSSWQSEAQSLFRGEGSFGNGSAMRVAPLGAYFADDPDELVDQAERSAVVTHCHAEAVAGAIAVALAAGIAVEAGTRPDPLTPRDFLERVCAKTPASAVRRGIQKAIELPAETTVDAAVAALGNGLRVSAPDTVPFALWASAHHQHCFEDALWTTVSGLGDRDTTCAIVGGIVVMSAGAGSVPKLWLENRESLPPKLESH
jgi:ADP-ribosylglycohydrolase